MNPNRTFEDTFNMDATIQQLAMYASCDGLLSITEDEDGAVKKYKDFIRKFNHFKTLIRNGTVTLDQLRHDVLSKYGPYPQPKEKTIEEKVDDLLNIVQSQQGLPDQQSIRDEFLEQSGFKNQLSLD